MNESGLVIPKSLLTVKEAEFLNESNAIEGEWLAEDLMKAIRAWAYLKSKKTLQASVLLQTHNILMSDKGLGQNCGNWRNTQVTIGTHLPPNPFLVPHLMANWFIDYGKADTPTTIKEAHIRFEAIHPFIDGNGRIGRIVLNWQRLQAGLPILVIKEAEKQKYYKWFNQ